jgi:hypothetical protein
LHSQTTHHVDTAADEPEQSESGGKIKFYRLFQQSFSRFYIRLCDQRLEVQMQYPPDHGLPLIQLKERRREMVVALQNHTGTISDDELRQIATIQQVISAFEDVIADLDCEQNDAKFDVMEDRSGHLFPAFGRRSAVHSPA